MCSSDCRDTFDVYTPRGGSLLPTRHVDAAAYEGVDARELPKGKTATIDDICDFIVEYINSDVMVRLLVFFHVLDVDPHSIPRVFLRTDI